MPVNIIATHHYLPSQTVTSAQLETDLARRNPHVTIRPGLIEKLTGIVSRPRALPDEYSSTLAARAARELMTRDAIDPESIDLLIFAAATQDMIEPATSHIVQDLLGTQAVCFDVKDACNSFLHGLEIAETLLETNRYRRALLVVGEKPSVSCKMTLRDRQDFKESFAGYTFGDSGAAMLLESSASVSSIEYQRFATRSQYWEAGTLPGGGTRHPRGDEYTYFHGGGYALKAAFEEFGVSFVTQCLEEAEVTIDEIDYVLVHQVAAPFLRELLAALGIEEGKTLVTVEEYGNLAAATLPVGLSMLMRDQDFEPGSRVLLLGLAGGLSVGVTLLRL